MDYHMTVLRHRDGHTYVVIYPPDRCVEASSAVGCWAANPDLPLTWRHAVPLMAKIAEDRAEYLQSKARAE